jgi:hypothetical protein
VSVLFLFLPFFFSVFVSSFCVGICNSDSSYNNIVDCIYPGLTISIATSESEAACSLSIAHFIAQPRGCPPGPDGSSHMRLDELPIMNHQLDCYHLCRTCWFVCLDMWSDILLSSHMHSPSQNDQRIALHLDQKIRNSISRLFYRRPPSNAPPAEARSEPRANHVWGLTRGRDAGAALGLVEGQAE